MVHLSDSLILEKWFCKVRRFLDLWGSKFLPKGFQHQQMADCWPVLAENPFFHGVHCNIRKHTSSLLPDVPLSPLKVQLHFA